MSALEGALQSVQSWESRGSQNAVGFQRTAEDVPGNFIPAIYRQQHVTGIATQTSAHALDHNLEDIASMVVLGVGGRPGSSDLDTLPEYPVELHPLEVWSLGRCYDALDWVEASVAAYRAALNRLAR